MHGQAAARTQSLKYEALRRQRANELDVAEALYRQFLAQAPADADVLHMLGVICLQTNRLSEAVELILEAARLTDWRIPEIRHNLALVANKVVQRDDSCTIARRIAYRLWQRRRSASRSTVKPLVSIIVPSYCHGQYIGECLRSVFLQSYRNIELIVIDDGSTDGSPAIIEQVLAECPFPTRFIARENRGAHATINEGVSLARGEFVNVLNSDDRFSSDRMVRMVEGIAQINAEWGFSGVEIIDGSGALVTNADSGTRAGALEYILAEGPRAISSGFGLLKHNFSITTGNLFISRELFLEIGGVSALRYNHDWEFALRATLKSEPVYVPHKLYSYRLHDHNTIAESAIAPRKEAVAMFCNYFRENDGLPSNPFAPCEAYWGRRYLGEIGPWISGEGLVSAGDFERKMAGLVAPLTSHIPPILAHEAPALNEILRNIVDLHAAEVVPFDQAQRYRIAALAVEALRQPGQKFRILEVGANQHRRLGALLPQDDIMYLDREIPESMRGAADVVVGDATALDFPDDHFDVVIALDVLEHIPVSQRRAFLRHAARTGRLLTIIAAPFDDPGVQAAEADALGFWNALMAEPYRWLTEHAQQGLPKLGETRAALAELGVRHRVVGHGRLDLWCGMLKGHFAAEAMSELRPAMHALDDFYARHLVLADFSQTDVYRRFLFCSRDAETDACLAARLQGVLESSASACAADVESVQAVLRVLQELAATDWVTAGQ